VAQEGDYTLTQLGDVTITSPTNNQVLKYNGTQWVNGTDTDTGLTSVGLSMPSAFSVANSPLTANGTLSVTGAGIASQYIRGDGTLANFPTSGGGGSSVAYYFNSSVSQGTLGGVAYRELSKVPIIGTGTDITIATNGYIANYITDAGDPSLLSIPAGNWNFEMYFSANSGGGTPSFYVELYKYDGTTFTLIASSSSSPEGITNGTAIDLYITALAVPATSLTLTDRLAIRVYVNNSGRTITLHTEDNHLCEVITTFSTGLTALNGLTAQVQYFATGTSGTDFNISSSTATHTFNLPTASATNRGLLSSADWSIFNAKQNALTNPVTGTGTTNTLPKFTGTSAIGNSNITDTGSLITLGSNTFVTNNLGLGNSSLTQYGFRNSLNVTGAGNSIANYSDGQILSGVVGRASYYETFANTAAAAFTNNGLYHYRANQSTFGAGSTVVNQYGFSVEATLVGATNNYGFFGNIPSGTNRWNLFMNGTAANYLAGVLNIGTSTLSGFSLDVNGTARISNALTLNGAYTNTSDVGLILTANIPAINLRTAASVGRFTIASNYSNTNRTSFIVGTDASNPSTEALFIEHSTGAATFTRSVTAASFIPTSSTIPTNGMYLSGTNTLGFATNGTLDMVLNQAGSLGIGTTNLTGINLRISKTLTGATIAYGALIDGQVQTDVTSQANYFQTSVNTVASTTISSLRHFYASQSTFGAGSTITEQAGFNAESNLIGGTFNYGFRGQIPAGTNRWNLYMDGSANNYIGGSLGIGSTSLANYTLRASKNITGSTTSYGIAQTGAVQSDVTSVLYSFYSQTNTAATSFTLGTYVHYMSDAATLGAGSSITSQVGFLAQSSLTNATNNYGFYGNIGAATNRWNLYMAGTAANYFNGNTLIGTTTDAGFKLDVNGIARVQDNITISKNANAQTRLDINNTTSGTLSVSGIQITSDATSGQFSVVKYSTATTSYKTLASRDAIIFNNSTSGNISILNDFASGNINFAAGGVSTAQATLFSTGNLAIGTTTDVASAILQVTSTTKGFLPPRMTLAQRTAIASPATGLIVYQTDGTEGVYVYSGGAWKSLTMV
jgi:hypothetical protein